MVSGTALRTLGFGFYRVLDNQVLDPISTMNHIKKMPYFFFNVLHIFVPNCCPVRSYFFMHSGAYFAAAECRTIFAIFSDIIAFFMARLPKIQNDENTIVPY